MILMYFHIIKSMWWYDDIRPDGPFGKVDDNE